MSIAGHYPKSILLWEKYMWNAFWYFMLVYPIVLYGIVRLAERFIFPRFPWTAYSISTIPFIIFGLFMYKIFQYEKMNF